MAEAIAIAFVQFKWPLIVLAGVLGVWFVAGGVLMMRVGMPRPSLPPEWVPPKYEDME